MYHNDSPNALTQPEYSNALALQTMFKHFSWPTIARVLKDSGNNLDVAIDKLLELPPEILSSNGSESTPSTNQPQSAISSQEEDTATLTNLHRQIQQLEVTNKRVEDEKKKAMQWCVSQMEEMKKQIQQQQSLIDAQEQQLKDKDDALALRESMNRHLVTVARRLQDDLEAVRARPSVVEPLHHAYRSAKDFLAEGCTTLGEAFHTIETGVRSEIKKVERELRNEDKEWIIVDKMKDLANTLKDELSVLLPVTATSDSSPSSSSTNSAPVGASSSSTLLVAYRSLQTEEEREAWIGSVEAHINNLEALVKSYEEMFK